ncbi:MAG TPA: LysE family transporter [Spirochaetota bacterium]|nr:LysE family transporter [Spirochaetota bacterium]HPS87258.1 LysE family transporter [Spirochaetota bacterium]
MEYIFVPKLFATVIFGTVLGFLSSIPVGAVQLEVIKKTINGHKKPAIATAMGSALSDLLYGMLALFGFGDYLLHKDFQVCIYSLGIVVLSYLVYKSFREREYMLHKENRIKYGKRLSFITGFTIAITNPGMIIWWFIGFKLFADLNMFVTMTLPIKALFVFSGAFGLALYLTLVAVLLHRYKKSFSEKFLYKANTFLMGILAVLITYFIVKLVSLIFNINLHLNF